MQINFENILFVDIETVPQAASYGALPEAIKSLWERKSAYFRKEEQSAEEVYERAGIWAEFGRIICVSAGFIHTQKEERIFRVKSFYDADEKILLANFSKLIQSFFAKKKNAQLCAHNGKEFDFPYIARRTIINSLPLPKALDVAGSKPWEIPFLDTMELWKFGDYKHFCSLDLLTTILDVPSPKDDIDGSQVAAVYYKDGDIDRIVSYCEKDVLAVAQLLLRYKGEPLLEKIEQVR